MVWTIEIAGRPPTINAERSAHWRAHRAKTKEIRFAAQMLAIAEGIPRQQRIAIHARPILKGHRSQDVGACMPGVKAAIDGLVDAKIIPDDTPEHLVALSFYVPAFGSDRDALIIEIEAKP